MVSDVLVLKKICVFGVKNLNQIFSFIDFFDLYYLITKKRVPPEEAMPPLLASRGGAPPRLYLI